MSLGDILAGACADIAHCNCFVLIRSDATVCSRVVVGAVQPSGCSIPPSGSGRLQIGPVVYDFHHKDRQFEIFEAKDGQRVVVLRNFGTGKVLCLGYEVTGAAIDYFRDFHLVLETLDGAVSGDVEGAFSEDKNFEKAQLRPTDFSLE